MDDLGNLYGTVLVGPNDVGGMVFELTPSSGGAWQETVLASGFGESASYSKLVLNSSGSLFGLDSSVIFEVSPKAEGGWTEQTYFNPGTSLVGNPLMDSAGNLYGVSESGGSSNEGELYEVTP